MTSIVTIKLETHVSSHMSQINKPTFVANTLHRTYVIKGMILKCLSNKCLSIKCRSFL